MAKTQTVTISLEEYKELLLKEKPTDKDHEILSRILSTVTSHLKYSEKDSWSSRYFGDNMKIENSDEVMQEIINILKYADFDKYMTIWNSVQTAERNRKAMQDKIDQMNRAKELREEHENAEDN